MSQFNYSVKDLSACTTSSNDTNIRPVTAVTLDLGHTSDENAPQHDQDDHGTNFDETLQRLWNDADKKQLFRYPFKNIPSRVISEKYEFILQLNPDRASKRRAPQEIQHVNQPFNPDEFNFNKVKSEEIIMTLASLDQTALNSQHKQCHTTSVIINVSPLEYCHILLVPDPTQNQPQAITIEGLKSAVEVLLLSKSCDFRVGFNSLCGYASVNHHHYHAYYLKHRLFIEYAELIKVVGPCFEFEDAEYPAPGIIFVLSDLNQMNSFLQSSFQLISYLQQNDIAHNVYITRGSSQSIKNHFDCVRLIVWGRASNFGSKICHAFNPALCELAGHFPLKNEESYSTMTEEFIINELRGICQSTFEQVKAHITSDRYGMTANTNCEK